MLRVGLTGGIGTGKSAVGQMFVDCGAHLIDSDAIVHHLFEPGHPVNRAVVESFGDRVSTPDGRIDRQVLGDMVFNDPEARQKLNSLVHPGVIAHQRAWLDDLERQDPLAIGIVEAALMVEVGTYTSYDKLVVVVCTPEEQIRRLRARSGLTEDQALARIRSQMPLEEKAKYADYVIDNSGDLEATRAQVRRVYGELTGLVTTRPPE